MVSEHYDDLEQLRACFDDWDAELIQLGRSRSAAWTSMARLPSARVVRVHTGRSVIVRGTVPTVRRCLLLSSAQDAPVRWLGREIQANWFALLGEGAAIDLFVPGDATLYVIAMDSLACPSTGRTQLRVAPFGCISMLMHCAESVSGIGASDALTSLRAVEEALTGKVRIVIEASAVVPPRTGARNLRATAVARACRFVDSRLERPISLADLCRHCGVGTRTLEYGFRQLYDTTPISFIKSQRLSRTHDALLRISGQPVSIRENATRLGFTHMGQFAQDYRMLFGESPSATLRRARQRRDADRGGRGRDDVPAELTPNLRSDPATQQPLRRARGSG